MMLRDFISQEGKERMILASSSSASSFCVKKTRLKVFFFFVLVFKKLPTKKCREQKYLVRSEKNTVSLFSNLLLKFATFKANLTSVSANYR